MSPQPLEELIEIDHSQHPFVAAVRALLPHLETELSLRSLGEVISLEDKRLPRELDLLRGDIFQGYGYLASSFGDNREAEIFWTAQFAQAAQRGNYHPIIFPIDAFYSFIPEECSIPQKIFRLRKTSDERGKPYFLLLSDFSASTIFNESVLFQVPTHKNIDLSQSSEMGKLWRAFSYSYLPSLFKKSNSLEGALQELGKRFPEMEDDVLKIFLATGLFISICHDWQATATYGAPSMIIAPFSFHESIHLFGSPHGCAWSYRYGASLKAHDYPPFAVVEGRLRFAEETKKDREGKTLQENALYFSRQLAEKGYQKSDIENKFSRILKIIAEEIITEEIFAKEAEQRER